MTYSAINKDCPQLVNLCQYLNLGREMGSHGQNWRSVTTLGGSVIQWYNFSKTMYDCMTVSTQKE